MLNKHESDYPYTNNCNVAIMRFHFSGFLPGYIDLIQDNFGFYRVVNDKGEEVEGWIESISDALVLWSRLTRLAVCPIGVKQWMSAE